MQEDNGFVVKVAGFGKYSRRVPPVMFSSAGGLRSVGIEADRLWIMKGAGSKSAALEKVDEVAFFRRVASENVFGAMLFVGCAAAWWNVGDA